jgi:Ca-activated chloride channel family protein
VRAAVLETALRHHLTSAYTSLVAVDTTPTRPESLPLATRPVPTNLPDGWNYEKIFGDLLPDRGPPAPLPPPVDQREAALGGAQAAIPVSMPQTATPMALHLAAGLAATVAFALVLLWRRRSA